MNLKFIFIFFKIIYSQTPLKIGLKNKIITYNDNCKIFQIKTNYKYISLEISNFTNIKYIQITDKIIPNSCDPENCLNDSILCTSKIK